MVTLGSFHRRLASGDKTVDACTPADAPRDQERARADPIPSEVVIPFY